MSQNCHGMPLLIDFHPSKTRWNIFFWKFWLEIIWCLQVKLFHILKWNFWCVQVKLFDVFKWNYFMSSSEMAPWKYSLVKIKPDLRLPSKYPTHFKLHQSILQKIFNKSKISNHIANYSGNTISQLEVILKGRELYTCKWYDGTTLEL